MRSKNLVAFALVWLSLLCSLVSCSKKMPKHIIKESKMEDILFDYHIAQALASQSGDSANIKQRLYTDAVFLKYGVTESEFDSSLVWYTRNTEVLFKIYNRINKRYDDKAEAMGVNVSITNSYASLSSKGDTANIWQGRNFVVLTPTNIGRMQFSTKADSSFHVGDRFEWHFDANFVYREGQRNAIAVLSVRYANDSVATSTSSLMSNGSNYVSLSTDTKMKIKSISGFIYLQEKATEKSKILFLSNFSLVRMHQVLPKPEEVAARRDSLLKDSIQRVQIADSVRKSAKLNENSQKSANETGKPSGGHFK